MCSLQLELLKQTKIILNKNISENPNSSHFGLRILLTADMILLDSFGILRRTHTNTQIKQQIRKKKIKIYYFN